MSKLKSSKIAKRGFPIWGTDLVIISKTRIKTWYGVFLIAFFTGVTAALIWSAASDWSNQSNAVTTNNNSSICTETDYEAKYHGNDYYKKGILTYRAYGYGYKKQGQEIKYIDYCETSTRLREYNCVTNSPRSKTYNCPYGCSDGACQPAPVMKCVDPDAQANNAYGVKNTTILYKNDKVIQRMTDYCETSARLREFTCAKNTIKAVIYNCPYGCLNGACKPAPVIKCVDADGNNIYVKNTVKLYKDNILTQALTDSCDLADRAQKKLTEYICQNNAIKPVSVNCSYKCQNGLCINK
jgi:hypothetical protein